MANFAIINNGIVENVIVANSLEDAQLLTTNECVDITNIIAGIGWTWDGSAFTDPNAIIEPQP